MNEEEKIEFLKELFGKEAVGDNALTIGINSYLLLFMPSTKQEIISLILKRESEFWANIGESRMQQKVKNLLNIK